MRPCRCFNRPPVGDVAVEAAQPMTGTIRQRLVHSGDAGAPRQLQRRHASASIEERLAQTGPSLPHAPVTTAILIVESEQRVAHERASSALGLLSTSNERKSSS